MSVFSLPTQRCFRLSERSRLPFELFSAYAEVFPPRSMRGSRRLAFLCLRRGVSKATKKMPTVIGFSLPTQRCFQPFFMGEGERLLFSAYAEVFPAAGKSQAAAATFLCLRRGVSMLIRAETWDQGFSLPTQRCFLGFADSGEPLRTFLCLRRGVSWKAATFPSRSIFSLPTQRCFLDAE